MSDLQSSGSLHIYYRQAVEDVVDIYVNLLKRLPLDTYQAKVVRPAVSDSVRAFYLCRLPPKVARLPREHLTVTTLAVVPIAIFAGLILASSPSLLGIDTENYIVVYVLGLVSLLLLYYINQRLRYSAWSLITKAVESSFFIIATVRYRQFGGWIWEMIQPLRDYLTRKHLGPILLRTEVIKAVHVTFWWLSAICIIILIRAAWRPIFSFFLFAEEAAFRRPAYYSTILIKGLMDATAGLLSLLDPASPISEDSYLNLMWRSSLRRDLRYLARIATGPWARQMRHHFGIVGQDLASHSREIALAMNSWQVRTAIMNGDLRETLNEMCDMLFKAATGNWHLISSGYKPPEHAGIKRSLDFIRRLISAAAAVTIALLSYLYLSRTIPAFYMQAIAVTCFGFAAAQLLTLIDPTAPTAFDTASKIGEIFQRSP